MPRISAKRKLLEISEFDMVLGVFCSKKRNNQNELIDSSIELAEYILSKRYFQIRSYVPKSSCWFETVLQSYDEDRFRKTVRATRVQFDYLLSLIKDDSVFISPRKPQMDTSKQLAIALYKFGHSGSGACYSETASKFGTGDGGSIPLVMRRVVKAILNLKKRFIFWPDKTERKKLSRILSNRLPGCIGFVDGSHCNFQEKPSTPCPEDYFSRKQKYGLHLQVVCDANKLIRHYMVGRTASAHDARVFSECSIALKSEQYFSEDDWIGGDAAYKLTKNVITPFRKNSNEGSTRDRKKFNRVFSSYRVRIEHTFGVLFEKFASLKSLSLRVSDKGTHQYACEWIEVCCILYNILHNNNDVDYYNVLSLNSEDEMDDGDAHVWGLDENAESKRRQLMNFVTQKC